VGRYLLDCGLVYLCVYVYVSVCMCLCVCVCVCVCMQHSDMWCVLYCSVLYCIAECEWVARHSHREEAMLIAKVLYCIVLCCIVVYCIVLYSGA